MLLPRDVKLTLNCWVIPPCSLVEVYIICFLFFRGLTLFLECSSLRRDLKEKFGVQEDAMSNKLSRDQFLVIPPLPFGGGSRSPWIWFMNWKIILSVHFAKKRSYFHFCIEKRCSCSLWRWMIVQALCCDRSFGRGSRSPWIYEVITKQYWSKIFDGNWRNILKCM